MEYFVLFLLLALAAGILWEIIYNVRDQDKKKKELNKWLEEEGLKGSARIEMIVNNSSTNTRYAVYSEEFKPEYFVYGEFTFKRTAEDVAKNALCNAYKRGYFISEAGVTYPCSSIFSATIAFKKANFE